MIRLTALAKGGHFCFPKARPQLTVIVMYQPDHFRVDDVPQMHALMRARPFAALISGGGRLVSMLATYRPSLRTMDHTESSNAISHVPIHIGRILPRATKR